MEEKKVIQNFFAVYRIFNEKIKDYVSHNDLKLLTVNQINILHYITTEKEIGITGLSEKLLIKKSSISVAVENLRKKGYIEKKSSLYDKRAFTFSITSSGKTFLYKSKDLLGESILPCFEKITKKETEILGKILNKLL